MPLFANAASASLRRAASRAALGLGLALIPTWLACSGDDKPVDVPVDLPADGGSASAAHPDDPLGVVLRTVGNADAAPARVIVRADKDIYPRDLVHGQALEGTTLTFDPPVEGRLMVTDRRELAFEPLQGFRPGTRYTARLSTLATLDEAHSPPQDDAWTLSFETPALSLLRLAPHQRDRLAGVADVDLVFTAAVDPQEVARRLELSVDGRDMKPTRVAQGSDPSVVRVRLEGDVIKGETVTVDAQLAPGLPWAWGADVTAEGGGGLVELSDGKPVEILTVMVKEGASGHFIEVVCNDRSVVGTRWYWDRDTWDGWDVSDRCMLDEDAVARSIHMGGQDITIAQAPAGFRIFGALERGPVDLRIDAGARTVDGGMLSTAFEATLEIPARRSRLSFSNKGRYLPRDAWQNLPIEHVNVDEARLVVRHVPAQNLAFWLSGDEAAGERTSNVVLDTTLVLGGTEDEAQTAWVAVGDLLPGIERGVYQLSLSGTDDASSASDVSRLLLTDMQLVAKRAAARPDSPHSQEVHAWALGMHDNAALSGVELRLVKPSGKAVATCRTGTDGGCLLAVPDIGMDETPPMAVVAVKGDDLTYLKFDEVQVKPDTDLSGQAYRSSVPYRAAVWTDRGVYRPGDVAHVAAVLRQDDHLAPTASVPVVLRLVDPRRREIRKIVLDTNDAGAVSVDLPFADFATTGAWQVTLEVAEREVGRVGLNVEEFVPERLAVEAEAAEGPHGRGWLASEEVPVEVDARWLFGGKAGGSRVEVDCELVATSFSPDEDGATDGQGRWSYGLAFIDQQAPPPVELGRQEDRLDEDGHGVFRCPAAARSAAVLGSAELVGRIAVFEGESGRSTKAVARVPVHPARHYVGVTTNADQAATGDTITVQGKVVDWQGKVVDGTVDKVQVRTYSLEQEYGWMWDEASNDTVYRRMLRRVLEDEQTVSVKAGRFEAKVLATGDGSGWLVDVRAGDARTERYIKGDSRRFYWDPWDRYVDATPRPQKPTHVTVSAPETADVGDTVTVTTKAPYAGRMLLTVETDRVQHTVWKKVTAGEVTWQVPLDVDDGDGGDFAPNVYVTALLLKDPHLESAQAFMPDRAFGAASVRIRPSAYSHQVKVTAPELVRPWSPLKVTVEVPDAKGPTWATVAVVDEGILSLTDFASPDPRDSLFARRALGVDSFETVGWTLLSQPGGPSSRTGGDAAGKGIGRVQMVKPVALWSGLVQVPASGKLDLTFDVPGYRGQLRVMAVAVGSQRTGSADTQVIVRDPIVLQATLPRFMVAGDIARIPVHLTNTSGKDRSVTVAVELSDIDLGLPTPKAGRPPALELVDPPGAAVDLADGESETVVFSVAARRAPSAAKLIITATAGDLVSREELELPIATAEPEVRQVTQVKLAVGQTDLTSALSGWRDGTDRSTIWVTGSPYASALSHLGHLVRYPYGCIEQTTSSTRPLLYVRSMVEQIDPGLAVSEHGTVDEMVAHGIERVLSMQTPSGGFAYWPGGSSPNMWGTAYATHMLVDAKEAGFDVPAGPLDSALRWLDQQVAGRMAPDSETAYAHYVIARAGKARPAQALRVFEALQAQDPKGQPRWKQVQRTEQEYLLMAALYLGGDCRYESQLKQLNVPVVETLRSVDRSFWSSLRGSGMRLAVFQDLFGADPGGKPAADALAVWLTRQRSRYYTTQELAWAITALGKRMQDSDSALGNVKLLVDGKAMPAQAGSSWGLDFAATAETVTVDAGGLKGEAWAVITTRGVRSDEPVPMGGQGLALTRTFYDSSGRSLDPARLPLGTPIFVKVDIQNTSGQRQDNIALVDRLPAGWEIENPRLSGADLPAWASEWSLWSADHMNLRDDRVEVFGELGRKSTRSVVFGVRAVTSGSFVLPPVQAEAMYDPDMWARRAGGTVEVVGPWDDSLL